MTKEQFKKKWENYWYYYKIHTIVAIVAIIVLAFLIKQCTDRIEPDMSVTIVTNNVTLSQERIDDIEKMLSKYTSDVNKDGRKYVEVDYINLNQNQDAQVVYAMQTKLMAQIAGSNTALYITDDKYFKQLSKQQKLFMDLSDIKVSGGGYGVNLSKLPDFKIKSMPDSYYNMHLSIRSFDGTTLDKSKNIPSYNNSVKVLEKLLKNGGLIK